MQPKESLKEIYESRYPKGCRVKIIALANEEPHYPVGLEGTVDHVDDAGQIHVNWDNGGTIALLPMEDSFEKLS